MDKLRITTEALVYLNSKGVFDYPNVYLALDDGSNKYSTVGGSCAIGNKFQLVFTSTPDSKFTSVLADQADYRVLTSNDELVFVDNGAVLDYRNGRLSLRDDSGILDGAVGITFYKPEALSDTGLVEKNEKLSYPRVRGVRSNRQNGGIIN